MLELQRVSKHFHDGDGTFIEALKPVSLTIDEGEFVVIVGPSGCGKSTLLNILAGFDFPSAGLAEMDGARITAPKPERGMVFQDYALFPWLSVIDNVAFGLKKKRGAKESREIAQEWLNLVGLGEFANKSPRQLSGGMKQRVAIARTFAMEPRVILMDEPFGALDALTRRFLQTELLKIWQKHRKTVVFVTHSVQEAIFLATRVIVITARPGRIKVDQKIDLPHPRKLSDPAFRDYEAAIYEALDEELTQTFNAGSADRFTD